MYQGKLERFASYIFFMGSYQHCIIATNSASWHLGALCTFIWNNLTCHVEVWCPILYLLHSHYSI